MIFFAIFLMIFVVTESSFAKPLAPMSKFSLASQEEEKAARVQGSVDPNPKEGEKFDDAGAGVLIAPDIVWMPGHVAKSPFGPIPAELWVAVAASG